MLRDEIELYTKLTGKDGQHTPICVIGAYLDGYEKGKEDQTNTAEWIKQGCGIGYRCTNCGKIVMADDSNELNFCCNCGAKMKGV